MQKKISILFSLILAAAVLPFSLSHANTGISQDNFYVTSYSSVDKIVEDGIASRFYPGAQLIIGDNEKIIYRKSYGRFTYDASSNMVTDEDLFDLASLTKVLATTPSIMKLYEEGKLDLYEPVADYIPEFGNNGKESVTILNLLLHNSGLKSWIPFYKQFSTRSEVLDAIYNINLEYPVGSESRYSDLNMILLGVIVERISGTDLNEFSKVNIFHPLGMMNTTFNPSSEIKYKILPTEYDGYWRNRQLKGEVHDEAASMLGGISGNAGLFSNAGDIYIYMNMILNKGAYSLGEKIFEASTIKRIIEKPVITNYYNTRTIGWDTKPENKSTIYRIPCGDLISNNCIGHTGYTGTSIWADLDRNLIIIFLTNRVYPNRDNNGILEIRPELHDEVIRAFGR